MTLAYITDLDESFNNSWTITGRFLCNQLEANGFSLKYIRTTNTPDNLYYRAKRKLYRELIKKDFHAERTKNYAKSFARQAKKSPDFNVCDILFSPGTIPIAHLKSSKPIVFWTDATFAGMRNFYPEFSNLSKTTIRDGDRLEKLALERATLAIYTSKWAADSAINYYGADPQKVKILHFGANLDIIPDSKLISEVIEKRSFSPCKLLFVGFDWSRKGGNIAVKTAEYLIKSGVPTELHIVGCQPQINLPDYVKIHGFISKNELPGQKKINEIFESCDFMIFPTRAECAAGVIGEAAAFGLPCLATNVGGLPTLIKDNVNGKLFDLEAEAEQYALYIMKLIEKPQNYRDMAFSSLAEFHRRFSWSSVGKTASDLINSSCM